MREVKTIVIFDTEFVSSKAGSQPLEIAMDAYELQEKKLIKFSTFSVYITLREGLHLNRYIRKYTGINEKVLEREGIYPSMAKRQTIDYFLNFDLASTLFCGWAIANDLSMFDLLFNAQDELFEINMLRWFDLGKAYAKLNNVAHNNIPALRHACAQYDLPNFNFHSAVSDASATASLLQAMLDRHGLDCLYAFDEVKYKRKKYYKMRES